MFSSQTLNLWQDIRGYKLELPLSKVNSHPLPAVFPREQASWMLWYQSLHLSTGSAYIMQSNGKGSLAQLR